MTDKRKHAFATRTVHRPKAVVPLAPRSDTDLPDVDLLCQRSGRLLDEPGEQDARRDVVASILRNIRKGGDARLVQADRGQYVLANR